MARVLSVLIVSPGLQAPPQKTFMPRIVGFPLQFHLFEPKITKNYFVIISCQRVVCLDGGNSALTAVIVL